MSPPNASLDVYLAESNVNPPRLPLPPHPLASWHEEYASSSWCYVGGLDGRLTEGDLICLMSEWGEIEDVNLCRDEDTGKSKGFGFVKVRETRVERWTYNSQSPLIIFQCIFFPAFALPTPSV